jgi:hypothetical protein
MACGTVVDTPKGGLLKCTKCNSGMLVEFDAPLLPSASSASAFSSTSDSYPSAASVSSSSGSSGAVAIKPNVNTSMQSTAMLSASLASSPSATSALRYSLFPQRSDKRNK